MQPVTFYTRLDCPLCEKAKAAIRASGAEVRLIEVDVDGNPELRSRFTDDVPVVYIAGREAFRHVVDADAFAAYVRALPAPDLAGEGMPAEVLPLAEEEAGALREALDGAWTVEGHELRREFKFADFAAALAFTNTIGAIAEELGHHPDILLGWGKVEVTTWTHSAGGLTRADFILAARIDSRARQWHDLCGSD
jgi:4a-hydroxytetrahydrobiopterin dehydratase